MAPSDDMVLMGEETMNDVRCNHYVKDIETPYSTHEEVWVANQSDLPPVVIRGLNRVEISGMVTTIETNVYDINTPITIKAPQ